MQFPWVPLLNTGGRTRKVRFRRSLVRNVVIILLLTSLFPILLIGTLSIFRLRSLLRSQVTRQSENIIAHEVEQIQEYINQHNAVIDRLATDESFTNALMTLLNTPSDTNDNLQARTSISYYFRGNPRTSAQDYYDQMFIIRPDASIALATDDRWIVEHFGGLRVKDAFFRELIGTNTTRLVFVQLDDGTSNLVLYVTRSFVDVNGTPVATLIATENSRPGDTTFRAITEANSFLPGSQSFYFTPDATIYQVNKTAWQGFSRNMPVTKSLTPIIGEQPARANFTTTVNKDRSMVFAYWLPEINLGVLLSVSEQAVLGPSNLVDPYNLVLLIISLIITGSLIHFSGTRLVTPLVHLADSVNKFSRGNWSERVPVNRTDEIGLLAFSFNHMADELSQLYHSLESAVESRTSTLRVASEVAQLATSTSNLDETLGRTVELIANRFGFYNVAIYLLDETGKRLVLKEVSGTSSIEIKQQGDQVNLETNTLISWVASNRQARILTNVQDDALFRSNDLLPDTQSEVAIPIILGEQVLGVLAIQSTLTDAFTEETVAIFQTLANQISNTLQTTRLLQATQISYQETILLYHISRQVAQARSPEEINNILTNAFMQLPYVSAILSYKNERFQVQVVTDPKTGQADTSLQNMVIPAGSMENLLAENRIALIEDFNRSSDYDSLLSFLLRRECTAAALVAVVENGRLVKVIAFGARESNPFTYSNMQPYMNLAEVIGASMEKFRVLATLQSRLSELQILANFSQAISAETNLHNLYQALHQQVVQTLGSDLEFAVAIYNQQKNQIEFPYFYEQGQVVSIKPSTMGEGLTSILIRDRSPLMLNTEQSIRTRSPLIQGQPARSWLGVPLIFANSVVGAMLIQDLQNENRFQQDDLNLIMTLAPQIATAVRNTQLYTEAQEALRAYDQERFLLNTLLDNMPEGISFKDPQGRYIRASKSVATMYDTRPEEMIGKTDFDYLENQQAEGIYRAEQAVMNLGKAEIGLVQALVSADGQEAWAHISRLPIRTASGDPYGLLVIQRDITELKLAEALAQRRAEQVLTAAEISRDTTGTLDVTTLLHKSVNLVRERFGFYHASIFLLDTNEEYAVLRESTGEAGQQMMQAGHQLAVGSKSIVGQVTDSGKPFIVNDIRRDPTHLPNPLLPETRSELAIPLKVGERILGALDVQSTQYDAFHEEDIKVLEILADQLAVALVNGELFAKTQELLGKHRLLRQISIAASSSSTMEDAMANVVNGLRTAMVAERIAFLMLNEDGMLQVQASAGYEGSRHLEVRIAPGKGITGQAAAEKRPIRIEDTLSDARYINIDPEVRSELAIPILFSGTIIGVLNLESTQINAFDENDQEILGALGNNLGGVIANIRLLNQVRQQVVRERQLFDITSQIRHSIDLGTILETSAREMARAIGARSASIRITAGDPSRQEIPPGSSSRKNGSNNGRQREEGE